MHSMIHNGTDININKSLSLCLLETLAFRIFHVRLYTTSNLKMRKKKLLEGVLHRRKALPRDVLPPPQPVSTILCWQ